MPDHIPTLLVVEDDNGLARLVAIVAGRQGWRVHRETAATRAVGWLEANPADLVLLDLQLDDGDALPAVPAIRAAAPAATLVACSARDRVDDLPFDAVLPKPYPVQALVDLLEQAHRPGAVTADDDLGGAKVELHRRSRQRAADLAEQLETVAGQLAGRGRLDEGTAELAGRLAHQLAGTAGMAGLPELSAAAREVEDLLTAAPGPEQAGEVLRAAERVRESARPRAEQRPARAAVLVVEPDPDLARLLCDVLRRSGLQVEHTTDGRSGIRRLLDGPPVQVVVLDLDLPDLHGHAVLRTLGSHGVLEHARAIVLSRLGSEQAQIASFDAGAFDHMIKPVSMPLLQRRVRRLVE